MKKFILLMMLLVGNIALSLAQSDTTLYIANQQQSSYVFICMNRYDRAIVYGLEGCDDFYWYVDNVYHTEDSLVFEGTVGEFHHIIFQGENCGFAVGFFIVFADDSDVPTSYTQTRWMRQNEATLHLQAVGNDSIDWYEYYWYPGGETTPAIEATEGVYSCRITSYCGSATRIFPVKKNVEMISATTDLATNRNRVPWVTTPEQADYIQSVNVYRNNQLIANVPYLDGEFIDDIGSDQAPWQYHLVAVSDGVECPLPSYWARTISMSDLMGSQGTQTLKWTPYEQENPDSEVLAYGIYDIVGGVPREIIQLGSFVDMYNYDPANFDGYAAVAAILNGSKDYENLAFSNRTEAPLSADEYENECFSIYPNPTNGRFTVEGIGTMRIANVLGQEIMVQEIEGKETVELPKGIYFVRLNSTVRKIVVE